jgi:hypothetical protein
LIIPTSVISGKVLEGFGLRLVNSALLISNMQLRLKSGAPDPPDTGDWDAICSTPSPDTFFAHLFREVAKFSLPEAKIVSEEEDTESRIQAGWLGSQELGARVAVVTCTETTSLPTYCTWETFGLPGMKLTWRYKLEYAGQLGHVAFRHIELRCAFAGPSEQQHFSAIWRRVIGKEPQFEDFDANERG